MPHKQQQYDTPLEGAFFGQLGSIYFFTDALPGPTVKQVHSLGPIYKCTFQPTEYVLAAVALFAVLCCAVLLCVCLVVAALC